MSLPQGWATTTLAEVVELNPKHSPTADLNQAVSFVPMPAVDEHLGEITGPTDRPLREIWTGYTHFQNDDVIFAKITPCMENGKAAVVRNMTNGLACGSTEFYVFRSNGAIQPDFLWRYIRQPSFRSDAEQRMSGAVGQRRVPRGYLEAVTLSLPPLAEQRRIVEKLDALTARLARARAELERFAHLGRRLRGATLAGHIDGAATRTVILGDVLEDVRYGTAKKCDYDGGSIPVLRIPNVQRGRIDTGDLKSADFDQSELRKLSLRQGDVLVIRSNGSRDLVGKSAVVEEAAVGMLYAGYLIRLRPDLSQLLPEYLQIFLASPSTRQLIENMARSSSGVNNINAEQLKAIRLPLPTIEEQSRIVASTKSALARADRLEAEAARAHALLDRLEAAILAKAFRGELFPQDPADEPAAVLLDRIRAQRASAPAAKRGRRPALVPA